MLSHLAHFKSYIWLYLDTKFITSYWGPLNKETWKTQKQMFLDSFSFTWMGMMISKFCCTWTLVTYTKFKCTGGYYNKLWSCWPLSFWKQFTYAIINCINSSQLSQEHSTNSCHKCNAVYQTFFQQLNYSQNLVLLHILKIATPILLCYSALFPGGRAVL